MSSEDNIGAKLIVHRKLRPDEILFGECQSVIVVTIAEENLHKLILIAQEEDVPTHTIGKVTNTNKLSINDWIEIDRSTLEDIYLNSLEKMIINE